MARPRRYLAASILDIAKHCSKCGEFHLLTKFTKDRNASDGYASTCNLCCNEHKRIRYKTDEKYRQEKYGENRARNIMKLQSRSHYTCNACKIKKAREYFEYNENNPAGVNTNVCKECRLFKVCHKCAEKKPLTDFFKKGKNRPSVYCKKCTVQKTKKWRTGNKTAKLQVREWNLKKKYGLSLENFSALHSSQGGKCAICRKKLPLYSSRTCVDHCHTTGKVRGILCTNCNTGIGQFGDSRCLLEVAVKYLRDREMS